MNPFLTPACLSRTRPSVQDDIDIDATITAFSHALGDSVDVELGDRLRAHSQTLKPELQTEFAESLNKLCLLLKLDVEQGGMSSARRELLAQQLKEKLDLDEVLSLSAHELIHLLTKQFCLIDKAIDAQELEEDLLRHIGPDSIYEHKALLLKNLWTVILALHKDGLTDDEKIAHVKFACQDVYYCTPGFFNRINNLIIALHKPKNLIESVYYYQFHVVERLAIQLFDDVHTRQQVFDRAYPDDQRRDAYSGILPTQFIDMALANCLRDDFVPVRLIESIWQSKLADTGFFGYCASGYEVEVYSRVVPKVRTLLGDETLSHSDIFVMEDDRIVNLNFPYLEPRLIDKLIALGRVNVAAEAIREIAISDSLSLLYVPGDLENSLLKHTHEERIEYYFVGRLSSWQNKLCNWTQLLDVHKQYQLLVSLTQERSLKITEYVAFLRLSTAYYENTLNHLMTNRNRCVQNSDDVIQLIGAVTAEDLQRYQVEFNELTTNFILRFGQLIHLVSNLTADKQQAVRDVITIPMLRLVQTEEQFYQLFVALPDKINFREFWGEVLVERYAGLFTRVESFIDSFNSYARYYKYQIKILTIFCAQIVPRLLQEDPKVEKFAQIMMTMAKLIAHHVDEAEYKDYVREWFTETLKKLPQEQVKNYFNQPVLSQYGKDVAANVNEDLFYSSYYISEMLSNHLNKQAVRLIVTEMIIAAVERHDIDLMTQLEVIHDWFDAWRFIVMLPEKVGDNSAIREILTKFIRPAKDDYERVVDALTKRPTGLDFTLGDDYLLVFKSLFSIKSKEAAFHTQVITQMLTNKTVTLLQLVEILSLHQWKLAGTENAIEDFVLNYDFSDLAEMQAVLKRRRDIGRSVNELVFRRAQSLEKDFLVQFVIYAAKYGHINATEKLLAQFPDCANAILDNDRFTFAMIDSCRSLDSYLRLYRVCIPNSTIDDMVRRYDITLVNITKRFSLLEPNRPHSVAIIKLVAPLLTEDNVDHFFSRVDTGMITATFASSNAAEIRKNPAVRAYFTKSFPVTMSMQMPFALNAEYVRYFDNLSMHFSSHIVAEVIGKMIAARQQRKLLKLTLPEMRLIFALVKRYVSLSELQQDIIAKVTKNYFSANELFAFLKIESSTGYRDSDADYELLRYAQIDWQTLPIDLDADLMSYDSFYYCDENFKARYSDAFQRHCAAGHLNVSNLMVTMANFPNDMPLDLTNCFPDLTVLGNHLAQGKREWHLRNGELKATVKALSDVQKRYVIDYMICHEPNVKWRSYFPASMIHAVFKAFAEQNREPSELRCINWFTCHELMLLSSHPRFAEILARFDGELDFPVTHLIELDPPVQALPKLIPLFSYYQQSDPIWFTRLLRHHSLPVPNAIRVLHFAFQHAEQLNITKANIANAMQVSFANVRELFVGLLSQKVIGQNRVPLFLALAEEVMTIIACNDNAEDMLFMQEQRRLLLARIKQPLHKRKFFAAVDNGNPKRKVSLKQLPGAEALEHGDNDELVNHQCRT